MRRREFTRTTAGVTAWTALSASRVLGANDRIGLALIGCGGRGRGVARGVLGAGNVEYRVMCDVWDAPAQQASRELAAGKADTVRDFRKALERKDVDAVHIATPDHWHAIPAVLACQAGKDVFVEKPFSYTIREGQAIVAAARQYKRLVMVGTQHRSAPHIAEAARIAQSGEVGDIYYVRVWNSGQIAPNLAAPVPDSPAPAEVDWDMYVGPAPMVPFNRQRLGSTYRMFLDYNNGYITDYGNHRIDSVYQIMNMDWPLTVAAAGGKYCKQNGGDIPDVLHVTYEFPNFILEYSAVWTNMYGRGAGRSPGLNYYAMTGPYNRPHGMAFFGTKGALYVDRISYEIFPEVESGRLDLPEAPARKSGAPGAGARGGRRGAAAGGEVKFRCERKQVQGADATELHGQNFIKFLRSRQDPFPNAETGHKATATCLLGMVAWKTNRKLRWDGARQDFIGDAEASKLLARTMRKPWDLIKV
ncbi:MAG: Gfo/Idh/MocA family oxidoreductase [Bryobacterales bacterium]|nr:Gfo/Idh/MocA family oxidoreductase [Bryobacterales bacterium]